MSECGGYDHVPRLTPSRSSLTDSPLASPSSTRASYLSNFSYYKPHNASDSALICSGEHSEAWWSPRASMDSSGSANLLDSNSHAPVKPHTPSDEPDGARRRSELQDVADLDRHPPASSLDQACGIHLPISEMDTPRLMLSQSTPRLHIYQADVGRAGPEALPDKSNLSGGQPVCLRDSEEHEPSAWNTLMDINVVPPTPKVHQNDAHGQPLAVGNVLPPRASISQQPPVEDYFAYLNNFRSQSSMAARCDQHSLSPPNQELSQTQSGRLALREAGIPHGSTRALAPSTPIENIPPRTASTFFKRLVHKAIPRSRRNSVLSFASACSPTLSAEETPGTARPRTARYSMSFSFMRTEPSSSKQQKDPVQPKQSRWRTIQRFIAKPSVAARATASGAVNGQMYTNAGQLSSVSFLGDPITRVDPFARPGGLGAIISDPIPLEQPSHTTLREYRRSSVPTHTSGHFSHTISFPLADSSVVPRWNARENMPEFQVSTANQTCSRDSSIGTLDLNDPTLALRAIEPSSGLGYIDKQTAPNGVRRRYSFPLLR